MGRQWPMGTTILFDQCLILWQSRKEKATKAEAGMEASHGIEHQVFSTKIDSSGRVVLPADIRAAMEVSVGDTVQMVLDGGSVRIKSRRQALREAQDYFCKMIPAEVNLVDDLLRERREEATHE
jgi:bifunctional DNA-binding transcriptional regulator/antitoxin component of YhaV-PrlF toxin-antitoxin module